MFDGKLLPKPEFKDCDETTLKLKWNLDFIKTLDPTIYQLKLQYKEVHQPWEQTSEINVGDLNGEINLTEADVKDLKAGTPYFVRLAVGNKNDGSLIFGPETVFDTKPIDCVPKKNKCIIS